MGTTINLEAEWKEELAKERRAVVAELFLSGELQGRLQAELALLFWEILADAGGEANMDQILEDPRSQPLRSTKPHSTEGKVKLTARTAVQALRRAGAVRKVGNKYYTKATIHEPNGSALEKARGSGEGAYHG